VRATTVLAAVLAALVGTLASTFAANDPDLFWHLASGAWMLDHGRLLDRDIFSTTMIGAPYSVGQWLGEVVFAALYRGGGWVALDLLRAALVGVATFFTARVVLRFQPQPAWAIGPIVAAVLISKFLWGDRPQLFSLALFPAAFDVLIAARFGAPRRLWVLVPLMLVWANLHGAFVAGLALIIVFVVEAWITRIPHRRAFTAVAVLAAAASLVTPSGLSAFSFAASYARSASAVVEERPADITSPAGLVFAALLLGTFLVALVADRGERSARLRSPILWVGLVVPFTVLGLAHQRLLPYAAMIEAPLVAAMVPALLGRAAAAAAPLMPRVAAVLVLAALFAATVALSVVAAPRAPDLSAYPAGATAALRQLPGPVLNEYDWGGYLIFAVPEQPTFVDGRGAALYPPELIGEFETAVGLHLGYRGVLDGHGIRLVLLRPSRALAVALREDGWPVVAEEPGSWVLLQRP
jgi:hypothetical protein